jgi:type II secretory pathway pseudopilin PulG
MRFGTRAINSISKRNQAKGFTLAEVMAALVFMAIVIPVALQALSIAGRAGEVAARKQEAALVAERVLNENIVTTNWDKAVQNGTIRQGLLDFRWMLRSEPWNEDPNQSNLRLLSIEVLFDAQGRDYSVKLSTLVDNTSPFSQTNSTP